jgi:hypothetical protein
MRSGFPIHSRYAQLFLSCDPGTGMDGDATTEKDTVQVWVMVQEAAGNKQRHGGNYKSPPCFHYHVFFS